MVIIVVDVGEACDDTAAVCVSGGLVYDVAAELVCPGVRHERDTQRRAASAYLDST